MYWKNQSTGEVFEHWKNPASFKRGTWIEVAEPASVAASKQKAELSTAFQGAIEQYAPGGSFGAGVEAGLVRGKKQSMASGMNALIGSGLAGTTMAAGLGKKYEEEVAAPIRAGVESTRAQNISALNVSLAQAQQSASQFGQSMEQSQRGMNLQKYMADLQARGQAGQLGLGYAQLNAQGRTTAATPTAAPAAAPATNILRVPKITPRLRTAATSSPAITPGQKMNLGMSSADLTALNKRLGNVATGF